MLQGAKFHSREISLIRIVICTLSSEHFHGYIHTPLLNMLGTHYFVPTTLKKHVNMVIIELHKPHVAHIITQCGNIKCFLILNLILQAILDLFSNHRCQTMQFYIRWRFNKYIYKCVVRNLLIKVKKTSMIRNQYNQVPHLSQDTKWESNKITINFRNKSQEVSPFPSVDHKAAMNRREIMTNRRHK